MFRWTVAALLLVATPATADDFNWHDKGNRVQMATIFDAAEKTCQGLFGFTAVPHEPKEVMADKIDEYLRLRAEPGADLRSWFSIFGPPIDVANGNSPESDDWRAGSALVAGNRDPSVMKEAKQRYMEGAMAPFIRALAACSAGTRDPFLGKYYWQGSGSVAEIEKSFSDDFANVVAATDAGDKRTRH